MNGQERPQSSKAPDGEDAGGRSASRLPLPGDGSYPFHPFLFALASVLALMANSLSFASIGDAAPALAGTFAFALAVYLAIALLRRRRDATTAVVASIWVAGSLFFVSLFGPVNRLVDGGFPMVRTLPLALLALVFATFLALRLKPLMPPLNTVLNVVALVLFATPAFHAAAYEWRNGSARGVYDAADAYAAMPELASAASANPGERPPDIYHFIFDRYASEGVLARHYETDDSDLGRFLEERGFFVARESRANYLKTGHSLASTFHMDYLDFMGGLAEGDDPNNWHPIHKMLDDHRVGRFLKAQGYDILQYGSWWVGTHHAQIADENHPYGLSEFNMLYLRRTMLRPVLQGLPDRPATMMLDWDNGQCQRVGRQMEAIRAIGERERPAYVFVHVLVPHGPYNFAPDGRCLTQAESAMRGAAQGYIDQVAYAGRIIRETVDALLAEGRRPPVIIVQSDEGPFPERDGRVPWQDAEPEELDVKTGILNAYYFPNGDYGELDAAITPVNTYRAVFNAHLGTELPLLQDRVIAFPHDWVIYDFHDVTEQLSEALSDGEPPESAGR